MSGRRRSPDEGPAPREASDGRPSADATLADGLAAALAESGIENLGVHDVRRLSGGASRETYSFEVHIAPDPAGPRDATSGGRADPATPGSDEAPPVGRRGCVLQRTRAGTVGALSMVDEADLLAAARRSGVAVPAVLASGAPGGPLGDGSWMVVERVEGETIARKILRDEAFAVARTRLVADFGAALAGVHRIDGSTVAGLPGGDPLAQLRQLVVALGEPHPVLELGFAWLEAHRPPAGPLAVVHGDFRLGNVVVDDEGLVAVLDWELAHRGDPLEDLGWLCVRAWRFGGEAPVAGLGSRQELFSAYEAAGGRTVDPEAAAWWEAVGCLRWAAICMLQANAHLTGASRSVELAAIGRRTCEAEYDLLLALAPLAGWEVPPTAADPIAVGRPDGNEPSGSDASCRQSTAPHDRPTATELLDAVGEFLGDRVVAATGGRDRFHARVAANVVAMVAREITQGPAQAEAHRERLASLGVDDDRALCASIAAGAFDGRSTELFEALWATTDAKVSVANPGYRLLAG